MIKIQTFWSLTLHLFRPGHEKIEGELQTNAEVCSEQHVCRLVGVL